eukprot:COSAG06_NODE_4166_length_4508_cov_7.196643_1_plen_121_part_10
MNGQGPQPTLRWPVADSGRPWVEAPAPGMGAAAAACRAVLPHTCQRGRRAGAVGREIFTAAFAPATVGRRRQLPTLPLSKPVSDRRSRDAAAGYGGNDHIVRAHTAAGTEQRGAPPPTQCT